MVGGVTCTASIVLASVITAIVTAILATVVFVLVEIVIRKCTTRQKTGTSAGAGEQDKEQELEYYEQIGDRCDASARESLYDSVDGECNNALKLERNEAYASFNQ